MDIQNMVNIKQFVDNYLQFINSNELKKTFKNF